MVNATGALTLPDVVRVRRDEVTTLPATAACLPGIEGVVAALGGVRRTDILAEGLALLSTRLPLADVHRANFHTAWRATHWGEAMDWRRGYLSPREMLAALG